MAKMAKRMRDEMVKDFRRFFGETEETAVTRDAEKAFNPERNIDEFSGMSNGIILVKDVISSLEEVLTLPEEEIPEKFRESEILSKVYSDELERIDRERIKVLLKEMNEDEKMGRKFLM